MSSPNLYSKLRAAAPEKLQRLIERPRRPVDVNIGMSFQLGRQVLPAFAAEPAPRPSPIARRVESEQVPHLRWLLAQATGTIAHVGDRIEAYPSEIDDQERAKLLADTLALEDEVRSLKQLVRPQLDWDAEYGRLLRGDVPPLDADYPPED